ncbi:DUF3866 family protein [Cellulosimicrobium sp. NPDC057127]|uniref:DUF3866 family protein n=1 Tax=Cellulosimicrobium sp. NPDC057127 TaxID=3346026 RepID=UPI0036284FC9
MITWRTGTVVSDGRAWPGAQELTVDLHEPLPGRTDDTTVRALAYTELVGTPAPGDGVLLNVSALARGLGTGGYALVVGPAAPGTPLPPDPAPGPGHLVKARYTPLQALVLGVDEQESPHHDTLRYADDLHGLPVVVADLHSALPAVVAGARHAAALAGRPAPRVAYVMTDGGALPAAFSRTVATLRETGWVDACVTVGQAFGGDLEAVTVHTGLLAARHVLGADLVVVAQGPGNLGTGTRWGYSGVAAGEALNAAAVLRGRPVASLRVSGADPRDRHRGVSHHSLTAYGRVALTAADVVAPQPVPDVEALPGWGTALTDLVDRQASALTTPTGRHHRVDVPVDASLLDALRAAPVRLSTMGRGLDDDPAAFLTAAAAGVHAERLARA